MSWMWWPSLRDLIKTGIESSPQSEERPSSPPGPAASISILTVILNSETRLIPLMVNGVNSLISSAYLCNCFSKSFALLASSWKGAGLPFALVLSWVSWCPVAFTSLNSALPGSWSYNWLLTTGDFSPAPKLDSFEMSLTDDICVF